MDTQNTQFPSPVWATAYDLLGRVTSETDPLANTTQYVYDGLSRQIERIDAQGGVWTTTFDLAGNVTASTDALDRTTFFVYDALDRPVQRIDALGGVWETAFDAAGNVTASTDARGNTVLYVYDELYRQVQTIDALGQTTGTAYDAAGNVISRTDELGFATHYVYDDLNRQVQFVDPTGAVTTTAFDAAGNVSAITDPLGHTQQFGYDALYRRIYAIDALGGTTVTTFDLVGNMTSLVDPVANQTQMAYDNLDREIRRTDPLGQDSEFAYDTAGRLASSTDRLGRRREFAYDVLGRLVTEVWLSAAGAVVNTLSFTFDPVGNQLSAGDDNGNYTYQYDDLDRVTDVLDPFGLSLGFAYDEVGNRTQTADSLGGITDSIYDANNQLVSRQFSDGQSELRIDQAFTARGELDTIARYSDLAGTELVGTSDYSYDPAGRILALVHRDAAGNLIADYGYSWDSAGRLLSQTDHGETKTYDYDATDQLTADGPRSFAYDPNGNRTIAGYETGPDNRLLSDGTWNYSYDAEGNLTQKIHAASGLAWTYGYDHRNQLVEVEKRTSDGGPLELSADYKYDVHGLRIEKDVDWDGSGPAGSTMTKFALDGWDIYGDLDYASSLTTRYVRTDIVDQVFARLESDGLEYWNFADHLLSIRDITDNSGVVKDNIAYDAFGNIIAETEPTYGGRYKYTGREYDVETDLQYNRARYYDAATGRWLSQDPLGFEAGDSNLYRYVRNRPISFIDPSGLVSSIPDPGLWSFVPVLGSVWGAAHHFQKGEFGWGIVYSGLAVWEATGVGSLIKGVGQVGITAVISPAKFHFLVGKTQNLFHTAAQIGKKLYDASGPSQGTTVSGHERL